VIAGHTLRHLLAAAAVALWPLRPRARRHDKAQRRTAIGPVRSSARAALMAKQRLIVIRPPRQHRRDPRGAPRRGKIDVAAQLTVRATIVATSSRSPFLPNRPAQPALPA
jgi:hypothetical protein